jgi:hypothetical protein
MEKDPSREKEAFSTLIDHPPVKLLTESSRIIGNFWCANASIWKRLLDTLKAKALCFVALEVARWYGIQRIVACTINVDEGVLISEWVAIFEIKTGGPFEGHELFQSNS